VYILLFPTDILPLTRHFKHGSLTIFAKKEKIKSSTNKVMLTPIAIGVSMTLFILCFSCFAKIVKEP